MVNDVMNGILNALSNVASGLYDFILMLIGKSISIVLYPINSLFETFLPNLSSLIENFSNFLLILTTAPINYVFHLFPPVCRGIILTWLLLLIAFYSILWVYRGIILVPKIINKIKFW